MSFKSILFKRKAEHIQNMPECFVDLNLDQVIDTITAGKEEYNLKPFFYTSLSSIDEIVYRQQVMQDIEDTSLYGHIKTFANNMREMCIALVKTEKCTDEYQKKRLFLDLVEGYCDAINSLAGQISGVDIKSEGFLSFRNYLTGYTQSAGFTSLVHETKQLMAGLAVVKYAIVTKELRVQVRPYRSETDYSAEVEKTFAKFKQEPVKDYKVKFESSPEMNHVEAAILKGLAGLYPELFGEIDDYFIKNAGYLDETIAVFDREVQFYIAWLEYTEKIKKAGLPFCYPEILRTSKDVSNYEGFDIALAYKLVNENIPVVCNDFYMEGRERIIMITGPNQGGKTTSARTFGQLHYLANIGCTVPGREATLFLFDKLLTHFEKEENIQTHRSKFEDDLYRIHDMLDQATSDSVIIMNEILSSTTLQDAIFLCEKVMEKIDELDALCVWVTFIDELIPLSKKTVSMVSTVVPENPAVRTFKVIRKPADGFAYALSIAEKYNITYNQLKERIQ